MKLAEAVHRNLIRATDQIAEFVYVAPDDPKYAVLAGFVMAFSAMGLWSGTKNIIGK